MKKHAAVAPSKSGAPFLILVTLIIVIYIIFLPPDVRKALLDDTVDTNVTANGGSGDGSSDLVTEADEYIFKGPGQIDQVSRSRYDHDITPVHLKTSEGSEILFTTNPFSIKYNTFTHKNFETKFVVNEPQLTANTILVFQAPTHQGTLTITLNGHEIYSGRITSSSPEPITIPANLLLNQNILTFDVDSPGWKFWTSNTYEFKDLRIQGDVTDVSRQASSNQFTLKADEVNAIDTLKLTYIPECDQQFVGQLTAKVNGVKIFQQTPDCGVFNTHYIDKSSVSIGQNTIEFALNSGDALIDRIRVITNIDEEANDITYFFEMDKELFNFQVEEEHVCGEVDNYCPDNCNEDLDKDCCFQEYTTPFWCDVQTDNSNDRCVGNVREGQQFRCKAGYEDVRGDLPEDFEGICGDDNDNTCPLGCSRFYDKDCCLEDNSGRYWCDDMPASGLIDVCRTDLPADACRLCPSGYEGEDSNPRCDLDSRNPIQDEVVLKDKYKVAAEFLFVDDNRNKEAEVIINGFTTNFDTFEDEYQRDISTFVKDGSNYITIRPRTDFSLVEVRIDIDRR